MLWKYIDLGPISLVESFASPQHIKGQKEKEIAPGEGEGFFYLTSKSLPVKSDQTVPT